MAKNDFIKNKNNTKTTAITKQKPKWSFYVVLALMVVWTIASILSFGLTVKDCTNSAKADTVDQTYSYTGSNVILPIIPTYFSADGQTNLNHYTHGTLAFSLNLNALSSSTVETLPTGSNVYAVYYNCTSYYTLDSTENGLESVGQSYRAFSNLYGARVESPNVNTSPNSSTQLRYFVNTRRAVWFTSYRTSYGESVFYDTPFIKTYFFVSNSSFTANIVKITLGNYVISLSEYYNLYPNDIIPSYYINNEYSDSETICFNTIRYYDLNNNYLQVEIPAPTRAVNGGGIIYKNGFCYLMDRTYYTNAYFQTNAFYNEAFNDGLTQGIEQGRAEQKAEDDVIINEINSSVNERINQARQEADQTGFNRGYAQGYDEGANDANQYSFFNLITSVIDVPVKAFTEMFNFELLGVNMRGFYTSLLTIAIIITVIKLIL